MIFINNVKFFLTAFTLLMPFIGFLTQPLAAQYWYVGTSQTARVAYATSAVMQIDAVPTCNKCQSIIWIILWDQGKTEQYVEAGIGWDWYNQADRNSVRLWYGTPTKDTYLSDVIPLGTPVEVSLNKVEGKDSITVTWQWGKNVRTKIVSVKKWKTGPGIHPTKIEVATNQKDGKGNYIPPSPVNSKVADVAMYPEDTGAILYQTPTYPAVPGSTLTDFQLVKD